MLAQNALAIIAEMAKDGHRSPAGWEICTRTRTRAHCTRGRYRCTPHRVGRGVVQNPWYHRYLRARTTPSPLVNLAKGAHTSIDVRHISRGDMGGGWAEALTTLLSPRYPPLSLLPSSLVTLLSPRSPHPYLVCALTLRTLVCTVDRSLDPASWSQEVMVVVTAGLLLPPLLCRRRCCCCCCCSCCCCRCYFAATVASVAATTIALPLLLLP